MTTHESDGSHSASLQPEKQFHMWRLLGVIAITCLVMAGIAALVDMIALADLR